MADYIKIPTDFFRSEPIKNIEKLDGADGTILLYIHLLCQSYKSNRKGMFSIADIPLTDDVLFNVFNYENIGEKLKILESFNLIERHETSIKVFKFWQEAHDRSSQRYKEWRLGVFMRDGFKCQVCGTKKELQAHHIKSWKKWRTLRYDVSNGITLCRDCHLEAHGGCWKNGD